ncbi:6-hydroxymethylpterin diphosphokinase MptE-like protein [Rhodoferax sp.]|uniref:motility associated factor glycosyltransferase family protein n=1 Tax=Rhodoferax sp. TaxID=50421 RepID=UPI00283C711A|nr:6-hydroxymethylpterin diphosphokinase MptE-like protein [Rhodoferax sp.]MDR3371394.1 DUF115 domain-containing protein [Rhodoferax sp.]
MQTLDNENVYETNLSALRERWPLIADKVDQAELSSYKFEITLGDTATVSVNGKQLTSRHNAVAEAEVQASVIPATKVLHLYGFGLGFLADHLLSTRLDLQHLEIRLTNLAIFKFVIGILNVSHILSHPKVNIGLASLERQVISPYFALPESLSLCDDDTLKMRDHIHHAVRLAYVNNKFSNDEALVQRSKTFEFHVNGKSKAVSTLFKLKRPGKACVIASGPSLEDNIEKLKKILAKSAKNITIACDTAVAALNNHGITPDFVVTIDQRIGKSYFKNINTKKTALVFFPTTSKEFIDDWEGAKYYAISTSFLFDHLKDTESINTLIANGSVIHPTIDLSIAMGYKEIILFGADFSFIKNKTHAYWPSGQLGGNLKSEYFIHNGKGEKVVSEPNMASYLLTVETLIFKNKDVKFYNTSLDGALIAGTTHI